MRENKWLIAVGALIACTAMAGTVFAHGVAGGDQAYLSSSTGVKPFPFMYLGAKHMVTGYDHLLYLAGVIFFLHRTQDVIKFVSLFAVGHSITLLIGVLMGINVNPSIVDAVIGLSVCYKALENLGVITFLDPRKAVFGFGLVHGFGLSSKLQDLAISEDGLVPNMLYFNLGVELGQIAALTFLLLLFSSLRTHMQFKELAINVNVLLFSAGFVLFAMHTIGVFTQ